MQTESNSETNDPDKQRTDHPKEEDVVEQDFFKKLQEKEQQEGTTVRGKGHGWTTLIETFLGDW